jgi:UPF0755 protein
MDLPKRTPRTSWILRFFVFFVVILFGAIGLFLWWRDGSAAVNPQDSRIVNFSIKKGEAVNTISSRLAAEGLVRSRTIFFLTVKFLGIENTIQAGNFRLNRSMDAERLAKALTQGSVDTWVTTLEGWRVEEVAQELSQELGIPEQEFLAVAQEGYMFPDTYLFPKEASASMVAKVMKDTFNKRFTDEMKQAAANNGLTVEQVVTIASLVEREGKTDTDRPMIAGIILKRLRTPGWTLDIDATLQYMLGYQKQEKTWWKKGLTNEDKKINSPYNTYKNAGLPPGPISNPGLSALRAVVYPKESAYWFYLHAPDGQIYYGETLAEHEANIQKYLQ